MTSVFDWIRCKACLLLGGHRPRYVDTVDGVKLITCQRCHATQCIRKSDGRLLGLDDLSEEFFAAIRDAVGAPEAGTEAGGINDRAV